MNQKIWVVEKVTPKGTVCLTRLVWSMDMLNEPGVMRRTTETVQAKIKAGIVYKKGLGTFSEREHEITLKTDRIEEAAH